MTKGLYIQLVNRSTSRIVFSACTDEVSEEAFRVLWNSVGKTVYKGIGSNADATRNYYEIQISPLTE
jgi:hypothetical protein